MRILILAALFPPDAKGGAELSSYHAARWLRRQGHEVAVLTTTGSAGKVTRGEVVDGLKVWRLVWGRPYPRHLHDNQPAWKKAIWHLQDHLDPRNKKRVGAVLREFKPDIVHVHLLPGIGYNALAEVNRYGAPVLFFLHDLGLACFRCSMYRSETNCETPCTLCRASSASIFRHFKPESYTFISPSSANLEQIRRFTQIDQYQHTVLPNLDMDDPVMRRPRSSRAVRLIYVGRMHETKGIRFLLDVVDKVNSEEELVTLTVVGGGPIETELKTLYGDRPWVTFTGKVAPDQVKGFIANSDALCLPSILRENHPGVVRQALRAGVPAIVSDQGGSSEMVTPGVSGWVLRGGHHEDWIHMLRRLATDGDFLDALQEGAARAGGRYDVNSLGKSLLNLVMSATTSAQERRALLEQSSPAAALAERAK